MTKASENSEPKTVGPKKGGWPLLIGVWALVEAVASGWGVGAAFLAYHMTVRAKNKDNLKLLRDPDTAKKLSSFQALQFLSLSSMFLFIPYILYMIGISLVKALPLQGHIRAPLLFIDNLCVYANQTQCPELISINYIILNVLFILVILLYSIINTNKTIVTHVKVNLFNFIYRKWMMNIFVISGLGFFICLITVFFKDFTSLFIKLLNVDAIDFNTYLQGSTAFVFVPFFLYMIIVYIYSLAESLIIITKIYSRNIKDLYVLYNNILDVGHSKEIRNLVEIVRG